MIIEDNELEIPDMFDIDIRQNNSKFMESCIREVIENMFRIRLKYEEQLSRKELLVLDQFINGQFNKDKMKEMVINQLKYRMNGLYQIKRQMYRDKNGSEYKDYEITEKQMGIEYRKLTLLMSHQTNLKKIEKIQTNVDNIESDNKNRDDYIDNDHDYMNYDDDKFQQRIQEMNEDYEYGMDMLDRQSSGYDYVRLNEKGQKSESYRQQLLDNIYEL